MVNLNSLEDNRKLPGDHPLEPKYTNDDPRMDRQQEDLPGESMSEQYHGLEMDHCDTHNIDVPYFTDCPICMDEEAHGAADLEEERYWEDEASQVEQEQLPFDDAYNDNFDQEIAKNISKYMSSHVGEFVDPFTDEINITAMAEQTAIALGHPDWTDDEQHIIWDLAVDVSDVWAEAKNIRSRIERDPINGHHPDCQCTRCKQGDGPFLWLHHPEDY